MVCFAELAGYPGGVGVCGYSGGDCGYPGGAGPVFCGDSGYPGGASVSAGYARGIGETPLLSELVAVTFRGREAFLGSDAPRGRDDDPCG